MRFLGQLLLRLDLGCGRPFSAVGFSLRLVYLWITPIACA